MNEPGLIKVKPLLFEYSTTEETLKWIRLRNKFLASFVYVSKQALASIYHSCGQVSLHQRVNYDLITNSRLTIVF